MKDWLKNLLTDEEKLKYIKFGIFPLIAVILIVVIVMVDKPAGTVTAPETEALVETSPAYVLEDGALEKAAAPLVENVVPEIQTLIDTYFQARLSADPELLNQVFDSASLGEDEDLADRMSQQTEHIEAYENVVCYTKEGLTTDSYVVFVRFDIKFLKTDTLAPSLLWCYVEKSSDGTYRIVEVPDEATSQYIAQVEQSEDVKALADTVNTELAAAVAADGKLASIYNVLRTGLNDSGEEGVMDESEADTSEAAGEVTGAEETSTAEANTAETSTTETSADGTSEAETTTAGQ